MAQKTDVTFSLCNALLKTAAKCTQIKEATTSKQMKSYSDSIIWKQIISTDQ